MVIEREELLVASAPEPEADPARPHDPASQLIGAAIMLLGAVLLFRGREVRHTTETCRYPVTRARAQEHWEPDFAEPITVGELAAAQREFLSTVPPMQELRDEEFVS